ncbi:MAG TPA: phospho-sugar mutase, partial [Bacteroidales bacterium]|nr:phospho-sugar mutase [Bacteroidales bacterium]
GAEEIQQMMYTFRNSPPAMINGSKVVKINDILLSKCTDLSKNTSTAIDLPKSDVLQFFLEDGSKITVRPSGTEPKIKFYFSVKESLSKREDFAAVNEKLSNKINNIVKAMEL